MGFSLNDLRRPFDDPSGRLPGMDGTSLLPEATRIAAMQQAATKQHAKHDACSGHSAALSRGSGTATVGDHR